MANDLGTDIACLTDVGARFGFVSGQRNLAHAIVRRITTPRGELVYAPNYGIDVRDYLSAAMTQAEMFGCKSAIEAECKKDDRVFSASALIIPNALTQSMRIELTLESSDQEISLVLNVSQLTVKLLEVT